MKRSSRRRTSGIAKYMVGAAMTQEIIQELIQSLNMRGAQPSAR